MVDVSDTVTVQFVKNGRKSPSMEAKKLRGRMARQIVDRRIIKRADVLFAGRGGLSLPTGAFHRGSLGV